MPVTDVRDLVVEITDGAVELGGRPVLRGIDVAVRNGEVLAILGANGSGKSTLVRTMMGLVPTVRGEVRLFGVPRSDFHDWRRVGFVPQRVSAESGVPASVREVVGSGRLSRRRALWPQGCADRDAVEDAIAAVGLADRTGAPVATLSGGQQRRALVARALAGIMAELVDAGTTIVVVLHELGPLAPLITRVARLEAGAIVSDGPPEHTPAEVLGHGDEDPHPVSEPTRGVGPWP